MTRSAAFFATCRADGRHRIYDAWPTQVSLSPSPCAAARQAARGSGRDRRYVALLGPAQIGLGLLAYVNVRLEKHSEGSATRPGAKRTSGSPHADFAASVEDWPEVVACYAMTGEMDYLLRVHVEDMEHFSRFMMKTLLIHPAVADVKSSFALQRIKDTTALPLV